MLLVEFLFSDRYSQFRSKNYAFLLGQARDLGVDARWLCCWAPAGRDSRTRYVIDLTDAETELLLEEICRFAPTHVILSEKLADSIERQLQQRLAGAVVLNLASTDPGDIINCRASWLPAWLGMPVDASDDLLLPDATTPTYETVQVPLPAGVESPPPAPIHIVAGPECAYRRPIARNRFFEGVELPEGARPFGCSFCAGPSEVRYSFRTPGVDLAVRQCVAALETETRCTSRTDYVVDGGAVTLRIRAFFERILDLPFPPSRFFFSFRIDELLGVGKQIDAILPGLAKAGHSIWIYNMGVENFSPDENDRLNKGVEADQFDEVTTRIAGWEKAYPETFHFTDVGGFGLILFTPWTTVEDLAINLERLRRPGISAEGFGLTSKLQILPNTAIAGLARNDGLIAQSFEDFHYYDSGCFFRWDQVEVPWRFLHAEVEQLYNIACRASPLTEFPSDDPLFARVKEMVTTRQDLWADPFEFFERALRAVQEDPKPSSPEAILDRMLEAGGTQSNALVAMRGPRPPEPTPEVRPLLAVLEAWLEPLVRRQSSLAGFRIEAVEPSRDKGVAVLLESKDARGGTESLILLVRSADDGAPHFLRAGRFTLAYAKQTPLDTSAKQQASRKLAAYLAEGCRREAAGTRGSQG